MGIKDVLVKLDNVRQPHTMATNQLYKNANVHYVINIIFLAWALFVTLLWCQLKMFSFAYSGTTYLHVGAADAQLAASSFERDSPPSPPRLLD